MRLILPYPPSVNHYWGQRVVVPRKSRPFVQMYITEAGERFRKNVHAAALAQLGQHKPLRQRLSLRITFHPPDRRERDMDNPVKPLWDALTHAGVWVDDEQIDDYRVRRGCVISGGRTELRIAVMTAAPQQKALFEVET